MRLLLPGQFHTMILYTFLRRSFLLATLVFLTKFSFAQTSYWQATKVKTEKGMFGDLLKYLFSDLRLRMDKAEQRMILYYPIEDTARIQGNIILLNEDTTYVSQKNNLLQLRSMRRGDTMAIVTLQEVKDTVPFFKKIQASIDKDMRRKDSLYTKHGKFTRSSFPSLTTSTTWRMGDQLVISLPAGFYVKPVTPINTDVYLDSTTIRYQYQLLQEQKGQLESLGDFYLFEDNAAVANWQKETGSLYTKSLAWREDSGYISMVPTFNINTQRTKLDSYRAGRFFSFPNSKLSCYFYSGSSSDKETLLQLYSIAGGVHTPQATEAGAYASFNNYIADMLKSYNGKLPGTPVQTVNCHFYLPFHMKYSEFGVGSSGFYEWGADNLLISSDSSYCRKFSFDRLLPSDNYYHFVTLYAVTQPADDFSYEGFIRSNLSPDWDELYYQGPQGLIYRSRGHNSVLLHRYDHKTGTHYLFHADRAGSLQESVQLFATGAQMLDNKEPIGQASADAYNLFLTSSEQQAKDSVIRQLRKSVKENDNRNKIFYNQSHVKIDGLHGFRKLTLPEIKAGDIDAIAAATAGTSKFLFEPFVEKQYGLEKASGSWLAKDSIVQRNKNLIILKGDYASEHSTDSYYNLYYYTGYNKLSSLIYLDEEQPSLPYTCFLASLLQQAFE